MGLIQEVAAALWLGAVRAPSGTATRLTKALALTGAIALTAAWCGQLLLGPASLTPGDGWTSVIATTRSILTLVCLAWLASTLRGHTVPAGAQVVGVACLVALAAVGAAARPVAPPPAGEPVLASVSVAGQPVPVLVTPGRPGWNLVHLGPGATMVGTDPAHAAAATTRPGAGNTWAEVQLPAGRTRLWIGDGRQGAWLTVDTGSDRTAPNLRGPDGPECASQALGRLLSAHPGRLLSCPADELGPADAAALRATVRFIAERGTTAMGLVTDDSPRGVAAAAVVEGEATRLRVETTSDAKGKPLMVLAGWAVGDRAVRDVASGNTRAEAVYLAPWLLNSPLLSQPAGQLIPLRFDPRAATSHAYLRALGTRFPGESPSAAGYEGWHGPGLDATPVRLYAASRVFVPGDPLLKPHQHHSTVASATWLPNGTVTAVSPPWAAA
ncbi:hypothetical protein [Micromonospora sp. NPDC003776]